MNDPRLQRHPFGFFEVIDKPSKQELAKYYADKYYQSETANYRHSYPSEELQAIRLKIAQKAWRIADLRETDNPGHLLDVGCGEGFTLAEFQKWHWQVEGLDHSRAGIMAMNPQLQDRVHQGDLFELVDARVAGGGQYDVVWLSNVLEHVIDPVKLMKSLRRLIASDGVLVVTVPNDFSPLQKRLLDNGEISEPFWVALPDHLAYFSAESLANIAQSTGWHCREIQGDFPIDLFLTHPASNYVQNRTEGPNAHRARLMLENMIGEASLNKANNFYRALADVGLGRNLTAFLQPELRDADT